MLPEMGPPPPPEVATVMVNTANGMLPELLAEARLGRMPQLNADDEVVVNVQARVTADDVGALWARLLEWDDIHLQPADELRWTGRPLDALEPSAVVSRRATSTGGQPSAPWAGPKGSSAEAVALWEQQWPDQAAFALDGRTPREAVESIENHPRLELVLRELEFHAARVRRHGRPAPNMAAVREQLGMKLPPMVSMLPVTA
jgi:hypothetical protein